MKSVAPGMTASLADAAPDRAVSAPAAMLSKPAYVADFIARTADAAR